jgi:Protein of unknown function (DUF1501)
MKNYGKFSRRALLQGTAAVAGGLAASKLTGSGLLTSTAHAQVAGEKAAVLCCFLTGGFNAVFNSADSFRPAGTFGVTGDAIMRAVGNGLVVDAATFGTLSTYALGHMATVGVNHGISAHGPARTADVSDGTRAYYLKLALAMGGDAAIKAASMGGGLPAGPRPAEGDVSLQQINDMASTIQALGGADPLNLSRGIGANALAAAQAMSGGLIAGSPKMLTSYKEGVAASVATLQKPVVTFNQAEFNTAYALAGSTTVNDFKSQIAGAELMIRAGANFVYTSDGGWDSHGDTTATNVRNQMNGRILPPLKTFITRMLEGAEAANRNVVVVIMGDFARSLPGSDHATCMAATVIGKYVKVGTTGKMTANVGLAGGSPSTAGLWSYLAAAAKLPASNPLGANQHPSILL